MDSNTWTILAAIAGIVIPIGAILIRSGRTLEKITNIEKLAHQFSGRLTKVEDEVAEHGKDLSMLKERSKKTIGRN